MCYSHIGGKLGTLLMETFLDKEWIARDKPSDKQFHITDKEKKNSPNWESIFRKSNRSCSFISQLLIH